MTEDNKKIEGLIHGSTDVGGAFLGGVLGYLIGGTEGSIAGSTLGTALATLVKLQITDFANRDLSNKEKARVGAGAIFAISKIKEYIDAGRELRQDNFFLEDKSKRSDAEEIFEGVLQKSKNEHEEKKIKMLGNIFANVAFTSGLSAGEANHLIRLANDLTYRQLCLLSLIGRKADILDVRLRDHDYEQDYDKDPEGSISIETISIVQEAFELYQRGLIESNEDMIRWQTIAPNKLVVTTFGRRCYKIMGLEDISIDDIKKIAADLL